MCCVLNRINMGEACDFISMANDFKKEIDLSYNSGGIDNIKLKYSQLKVMVVNKKAALEQGMRLKLIEVLSNSDPNVVKFHKFLELCITLSQEDMVTPVLSVVLLGDIFDASTLDVCERLFHFVELNVSTWKENLFFSTCKNNILRMCNDLLRRLSKSQNTIFCGRILLFLAMFFPFSERSGLNIVSEFNLENVTKYGPEVSMEEMETNTIEEIVPDVSIKIDYNFYVKFWSLQDYFRSPNQCYNKNQWKEFLNYANAVLSVFKNYKVEADPTEAIITRTEEPRFFTKFLTNQKLLVLQMNDVNFRRTIYLQFLILFQFLSAHVKSKPESYELKPEQSEWINEATELIYNLIKDTPPDGEIFLQSILRIFEREDHWNTWKNEGCPALKPVCNSTEDLEWKKPCRKKYTLGSIVKESKNSGRIVLKCIDGTRIWEVRNNQTLDSCKRRNFVPSLNKFFEEVAQQADPAAMIEPEYKKVNNMRFSWSALRLLSMRSAHFFAVTHNPVPKLPDFLELMCKKINREHIGAHPSHLKMESKFQAEDKPTIKEEIKEEVEESDEKNEVTESQEEPSLINSQDAVKEEPFDESPEDDDMVEAGEEDVDDEDEIEDEGREEEAEEEEVVDEEEEEVADEEVEEEEGEVEMKQEESDEEEMEVGEEEIKDHVSEGEEEEEYDDNYKDEEGRLRDIKVEADTKKEADTQSNNSCDADVKSEEDVEMGAADEEIDGKSNVPNGVKEELKEIKKEEVCLKSVLKKDIIDEVAEIIGVEWSSLAEKLGYKEDEIEFFNGQESTDVGRAKNMLSVWLSNEDDATPENLYKCLMSLDLAEAAKLIVET